MNSINKLIWMLMNPFSVGALLLALALALSLLRRRRAGLWVFGAAMLWGWVWSSPLCFKNLAVWWETSEGYPMRVEDVPQADAIVDLGGGVGGVIERILYPDMHSSADREWHSARLWKAGKAPIVMPSGRNAGIYSKVLLTDLGVPESCVVCENGAVNTEENAKFVKELLLGSGRVESGGVGELGVEEFNSTTSKPKVLLVTSAWHMKRSLLVFGKYAPELEVIPVATDYESYNGARPGFCWRDFLPAAETYCANTRLFHEILGYCGYRWLRK